MNIQELPIVALGEDNEPIRIQVIRPGLIFVHAEGNTQSPFKFSSMEEATQFVGLFNKVGNEGRNSNV